MSDYDAHTLRMLIPAYLDCPDIPPMPENAVDVNCGPGLGHTAPVPVSPGYRCDITCDVGYAVTVHYTSRRALALGRTF